MAGRRKEFCVPNATRIENLKLGRQKRPCSNFHNGITAQNYIPTLFKSEDNIYRSSPNNASRGPYSNAMRFFLVCFTF